MLPLGQPQWQHYREAMMKNYAVTVSSDRMLSIFVENMIDEFPYRFQPDVQLIVSFEEYCIFCERVLSAKIPCLCYDGELHAEALRSRNVRMLQKLYFSDIATAALRELSMAVGTGRDGTRITHIFEDNSVNMTVDYEFVIKEYDKLKDKEAKMRALNFVQGYLHGGAELSPHNMNILSYIMYLRALSFTKYKWELFNLAEQM